MSNDALIRAPKVGEVLQPEPAKVRVRLIVEPVGDPNGTVNDISCEIPRSLVLNPAWMLSEVLAPMTFAHAEKQRQADAAQRRIIVPFGKN